MDISNINNASSSLVTDDIVETQQKSTTTSSCSVDTESVVAGFDELGSGAVLPRMRQHPFPQDRGCLYSIESNTSISNGNNLHLPPQKGTFPIRSQDQYSRLLSKLQLSPSQIQDILKQAEQHGITLPSKMSFVAHKENDIMSNQTIYTKIELEITSPLSKTDPPKARFAATIKPEA